MKWTRVIFISIILIIMASVTTVCAFENSTVISNETAQFVAETYDVENVEYEYGSEMLSSDCSGDAGILSSDMEANEDYCSNLTSGELTPKIEVPTKMWDKGNYNMTVYVPENFNSTLILKGMINANYTINKTTIIPIKNIDKGNYHLNATFIGEKMYSQEFFIDVYDADPNWFPDIEIPSEVAKFEQYAHLYHDEPPIDSKATLTLYVDGKKKDSLKNLYEGYLSFDVRKYSLGTHILYIEFSGDDYFKPKNYTTSINITDVKFDYSYFWYSSEIDVLVPGDDKGTITVYKDGVKYSSKSIPKKDMEYSDYRIFRINLEIYNAKEIKIEYSGKYGKIVKQIPLPVYNEFKISSYDSIYGEKYSFWTMFPKDLEKTLEIYVDGVNYSIKNPKAVSDGTIEVKEDLMPGEHVITLHYQGDKKYSEITVNQTFNVVPKIKMPSNMDYGSVDFIELKLPKDSEGNLTVYIKNQKYGEYKIYDSIPIDNGIAKISLKNLDVGIYYIKCKFNGNYNVTTLEEEFGVSPAITYPRIMTYGENKYLTFKTTPIKNSRIKLVKQNGKVFADVELKNGEAKISLSKMDIVSYDHEEDMGCGLKLYYYVNGKLVKTMIPDRFNEQYFESDVIPIKVTVNPIQPRLVGGKNIKLYYGESKSYTVKVYGVHGKVVGAGEIVTFEIGKKTYKIKTNKKGKATLKLKEVPKKYTLRVTYEKGSADVTVKNKITIKQVLTLKKVKVKKSAKKLVLKATLKKGKKPIKGKKITFKFKGKKYVANTNKKGIAKVTIKKAVLKKLKIGKKITYKATYIKDTVKKTVKIKK